MEIEKNIPIVVIAGATGTGKTKLSIELAKYYDGEIINADALQIYKGMDIATNKATKAERQGIVHHLLGFKDVETMNFTIHDFQKLALDKLTDIQSRNKMPILVGGTNYYAESVLWQRLVDIEGENSMDQCDLMNNQELHDLLHRLDPHSASILHPNDRRKVWRAISIAINSHKTQSQYLNEQDKSRRFGLSEIVFLWISSELDSLFPRLDNRVEEMIELGLLNELSEIQKLFERLSPTKEYTKGIFQAIGFKEFHDYLNYCGQDSVEKSKILKGCIEKLKTANKQYVRIQNKWVKNRFLRKGKETENIPLFKLDSTDVARWRENVFDRSVAVIEQIRNAKPEIHYSDFVRQLAIEPESLKCELTHTPCRNVCEICDNQIFLSEQQWQQHLSSRRHARRTKQWQWLEDNLVKESAEK